MDPKTLLRIALPWCNKTVLEVFGTIIVGLVLLRFALGIFGIDVGALVMRSPAPQVVVGDVVTVVADAAPDAAVATQDAFTEEGE